MGTRNLAGLLAALAMQQPKKVEAYEVKNIPNGTFMISRNPHDPSVTALLYVVGPGPADMPGMHLAYMELPYPDGTLKPTFTLVEDGAIETADRTDPTFPEKAKNAANRLLTNRKLLPAVFNLEKRFRIMAEICEQQGFEATPGDLPPTPIGKFVRAIEPTTGKERFGLCIGVELYAMKYQSYGVLIGFRADPWDANKECTCGKVHAMEPGVLTMFMVDAAEVRETTDTDDTIRLDAMRAVGADVFDRRSGEEEYASLQLMGMANGVSSFCEGTRFADECLAEFEKMAQGKGTIGDVLDAVDKKYSDN